MYERGDVLTLSNNVNYVVVTTTTYENNNYVYLINEKDQTDIMFAKYQGEEFERVTDTNVIEKLLQLIMPEMKQIIAEAGMEQ